MTDPRPSRFAPSTAALPPERAFVIQLLAPADGEAALFVGRAEHVATGEAAPFASVGELVAFVRHVLTSDATPPAGDTNGGAVE